MAGDPRRAKMLTEARWHAQHEPSWHYAQVRPIPLSRIKQRLLPITTDCSGGVTGLAYAGGIPDPNDFGYNGQGYTGSLLQGCPHILQRQALAGDFVAFGPYPGEHVVMLMEAGVSNGSDPLVWSHGQEGGPLIYRLSSAKRIHHTPVVFLRSVSVVAKPDIWDVRNGRNELIGHNVKHPALWAKAHADYFRKFGQVNFIQRRQ